MAKKSELKEYFTKEEAINCYEKMLYIRRFEEKCGQIYGMGQIFGFCHLYIGQEAIAVGIHQCTKRGDSMITGYRDHGHSIVMGSDPKAIMSELMGKETGLSKGKGGSMHIFDCQNGFYGGHGIVGAQVSLGTGIGFAEKYKGTDNVSVVFFGDGASNQGQVYESFNMAKLWNLPILYIIENNKYAMGTSVNRHLAKNQLHKRGDPYGIEGKLVNGMDVVEVKKVGFEAINRIRKGSGPLLLEMETYRYRGHSMSDPAKYRTKEEVERYKTESDPILLFEQKLKSEKWITDKKIEEFEVEIKKNVNECYKFGLESSEPDESEIFTNVYC